MWTKLVLVPIVEFVNKKQMGGGRGGRGMFLVNWAKNCREKKHLSLRGDQEGKAEPICAKERKGEGLGGSVTVGPLTYFLPT